MSLDEHTCLVKGLNSCTDKLSIVNLVERLSNKFKTVIEVQNFLWKLSKVCILNDLKYGVSLPRYMFGNFNKPISVGQTSTIKLLFWV